MKKETILAEIGSLKKGDVLEIRMIRKYSKYYSHNTYKLQNEFIYQGTPDKRFEKIGEYIRDGWYYKIKCKNYRMVVVSNSSSKEQLVLRKYNSLNRPRNTEIYDYKLFLKSEYFIVGKRKSFLGVPYIKHNQ